MNQFMLSRKESSSMKKIFITLMALLMIAASLVLAGCNKNKDDNQDKPTETEAGKPIYYSRDSLYAYTLNDNNEATLVAYTGTAANVVLNRIDGKQKIVAIIITSRSNAKRSTSQLEKIFFATVARNPLIPHCESLSLKPAASAMTLI